MNIFLLIAISLTLAIFLLSVYLLAQLLDSPPFWSKTRIAEWRLANGQYGPLKSKGTQNENNKPSLHPSAQA